VLIYDRSGSPLAVPFLAAVAYRAGTIPYLFGGLFLAGLGDRLPRRAVMPGEGRADRRQCATPVAFQQTQRDCPPCPIRVAVSRWQAEVLAAAAGSGRHARADHAGHYLAAGHLAQRAQVVREQDLAATGEEEA
jgi:hypothetical protein